MISYLLNISHPNAGCTLSSVFVSNCDINESVADRQSRNKRQVFSSTCVALPTAVLSLRVSASCTTNRLCLLTSTDLSDHHSAQSTSWCYFTVASSSTQSIVYFLHACSFLLRNAYGSLRVHNGHSLLYHPYYYGSVPAVCAVVVVGLPGIPMLHVYWKRAA